VHWLLRGFPGQNVQRGGLLVLPRTCKRMMRAVVQETRCERLTSALAIVVFLVISEVEEDRNSNFNKTDLRDGGISL
jgi:hypothetical protein